MKRKHFTYVAGEGTVKVDEDLNLLDIRSKVQQQIDLMFPPPMEGGMSVGWNCVEAITPTYAIYSCAGEFWKVEYSLTSADDPVLGSRTKVKTEYVAAEAKKKIKLAASESFDLDGATQDDKKGWVWDVRVISPGRTLEPQQPLDHLGPEYKGKTAYRLYTAEALASAVNLKRFEGVPFVSRTVKEHLEIQATNTRDPKIPARSIAGNLRDAYVASEAAGDVRAKLDLRHNEKGKEIREYLQKRKENNLDPLGLSITCFTEVWLEDEQAEHPTLRVTDIPEVYSIDPCEIGNAGGAFLNAAEAKLSKKKMKITKAQRDLLTAWARVAAEAVEGGADPEKATSGAPESWDDFAAQFIFDHYPNASEIWDSVDDVKALPMEKQYKFFLTADKAEDAKGEEPAAGSAEAVAAEAKAKKVAAEAVKGVEDPRVTKLLSDLALEKSKAVLEAKLQTSTLPEPARNMVRMQFSAAAAEAKDYDDAIRRMQDLAADMTGLPIQTAGGIEIRLDERDKQAQCMNGFFFMNASEAVRKIAKEMLGYDPCDPKYQAWTSYKEMFLGITGRSKIGGALFNTAAEALGVEVVSQLQTNALNIRMIAQFRSLIQFDDWKKIASIQTANDFRDLRAQKYGEFTVGVGVPTLASDDYAELTLDGAEETTYKAKRRGNLFSVNYADVVDDLVNLIQSIPIKLARMAKRDIYKSIFDLLWNGWSTNFTGYDPNNPTTPQTAAIFSSNWGNLGPTTTLSSENVITMRKKLMLNAQIGSGEAMGIPPKYLIHQTKNFDIARQLTTPAYGTFNEVATTAQSLQLERIEVPHYPDANERYFIAADPGDLPGIEIAFLYGKQEPTIIPEAMGTGANFTADKMRWKMAYHWGAALVDPRAFVGAKVS